MEAIEILKRKGVKVTQNRLELLGVLDDARHPLNQKDIENRLSELPDRVTLYRNLKVLSDQHIIHKIEINGSITSYSLNRIHLDNGYDAEHLHFYCNSCSQVVCMPQCTIKKYNLPDGFVQQSSKLIVNGICNTCNSK